MKRATLFVMMIAVLMLTACSTVQVSQDFRYGTDFSQYTSYQWQPIDIADSADIRVKNPLLQERFRDAIDRSLTARGFRLQSVARMGVSYEFSIVSKLESDPFYGNFGYGFGRRYRHAGIGYGGRDIRQYDLGILVVNVYDVASGRLIWRGTGSETVATHSSPEKSTALANRMVDAVLAQFPPL